MGTLTPLHQPKMFQPLEQLAPSTRSSAYYVANPPQSTEYTNLLGASAGGKIRVTSKLPDTKPSPPAVWTQINYGAGVAPTLGPDGTETAKVGSFYQTKTSMAASGPVSVSNVGTQFGLASTAKFGLSSTETDIMYNKPPTM